MRRCTRCQKLNHATNHCRQTTQTCPRCERRGHGREGCSVSPSCPNCSGPHSAAWLGRSEYRARLLAPKIKAQTYMPYNHAIRQAKQILHNHTDNTGNDGITRTVPHSSHSDYTQSQPQTATQKTLSYANMVRYGRELNISQTKTTQTTPKPKQVNTT